MKIDLKKIATAWAISFSPSEEQKVLAEKRLEVCLPCNRRVRTVLNIATCSACGCPLSKKVYTDEYNPCPLGKWEEIDRKYFDFSKTKVNKTVI